MKPTTVKQTLQLALKKIQRSNQWTKGKWKVWDKKRKRFCYCAAGAVENSGASTHLSNKTINKLQEATGGRHIMAFNDDPKTRHCDVVRAFKKAIENER